MEESLENELDSDNDSLNLFLPETICYVVENLTIEETLEKGGCKDEKKIKVETKKKVNEKKCQYKEKKQKKKQRKGNQIL